MGPLITKLQVPWGLDEYLWLQDLGDAAEPEK